MKRKLLFILALLCLTASSAWADSWSSGDCTLTLSDGVMTVSKTGDTGAMADYAYFYNCPWYLNCGSITSIVVEEGVTKIGNLAFSGCDQATSISLPSTLTSIGNKAFINCSGLTSITFPASVTSIGTHAFYGCTSFVSITIPASVTTIGDFAFMDCTDLATVTVYAVSCTSGSYIFEACNKLANIYVFSDKVDAYKESTNWSYYSSKISAIPDVTAREGKTGEYWATYYNNLANVRMSIGTQVFKVALTGTSLEMTEISDRIVNKGEGVVLKSNSSGITLASAASESENSYDGNSLKGTMTSITNPGNAYVLNYKAATGVGFYKLSNTGTIGVGKAYLTYSGALGAREFFGFEEDATSISTMHNSQCIMHNEVYDLQGRRVAQPTKGLYIVNGKKAVVK